MGRGRNWTKEEDALLAEMWGTVSIPTICEKLHRSKNAVIIRRDRLKLPKYLHAGDYITLNELMKTLRGRIECSWDIESLCKKRKMPIKMKRRDKSRVRVIYLEDFWKWAEKNRSFLDFSRLEPLALGVEPDWVAEQRHKDYAEAAKWKKSPWTAVEDAKLKEMVNAYCYGWAEVAETLHRTEGAIARRLRDLGIAARPIKAENHGVECKWTEEMFDILSEGIRNGESYELLGQKLGKSAKAIRGKVYGVYLTENRDKVRAMMGKGRFGDNAPEPNVRQAATITKTRRATKETLTRLDELLRYRMRQLDDNPFWQRLCCQHWDEVDGCTMGCKDCDACADFKRIAPQCCARCGGTFYERKQNKFCFACRSARKKAAQKKYAILAARRAG